MYKIGFVIEQTLGHITHTQNLQTNVPLDPTVEAHWGLIPWETAGLAARIPVYNSNWTVRAGLRARRAVARMVEQHSPHALFFHTQVPAVLATRWLKRIPSIISLDATPLQYDMLGAAYQHTAGSAWLEHQKWKLNRDCFRAAHTIVAWSRWAKQGLVADYGVPADNVEVIPPGVNPGEWCRPTPRALHQEPVKILFVGGDFQRKGGPLVWEAFRGLPAGQAELHLVTRAELPPAPGVFVYHDLQPNSPALKRLFHDCDIFCLPTNGDCLPMALSEAGAAGLPLISTQIAGIPEIVRDGETGLLVPPGDQAALTIALRRLVENPELRLSQGRRAAELVGREFDAQQNAQRLVNLLKQTIDEARSVQVPSR
jgi:glycosyltransferase involved in cell wall biosynthesis